MSLPVPGCSNVSGRLSSVPSARESKSNSRISRTLRHKQSYLCCGRAILSRPLAARTISTKLTSQARYRWRSVPAVGPQGVMLLRSFPPHRPARGLTALSLSALPLYCLGAGLRGATRSPAGGEGSSPSDRRAHFRQPRCRGCTRLWTDERRARQLLGLQRARRGRRPHGDHSGHAGWSCHAGAGALPVIGPGHGALTEGC